MGTVGYMAPEQVRGDPAGPAADLFALGALLYELVAGRPAFRHKTAVETLNAILKEGRRRSLSVSPAVERVIARCLEKDPGHRFRSAADVAFALDALSEAAPQPPPRLATRLPASSHGDRGGSAAAGSGALVAFARAREPVPQSRRRRSRRRG